MLATARSILAAAHAIDTGRAHIDDSTASSEPNWRFVDTSTEDSTAAPAVEIAAWVPQVEEPQVEEPQVEEPQVEEPQVEEPQVEPVEFSLDRDEMLINLKRLKFFVTKQTRRLKPILNNAVLRFGPVGATSLSATDLESALTLKTYAIWHRVDYEQGRHMIPIDTMVKILSSFGKGATLRATLSGNRASWTITDGTTTHIATVEGCEASAGADPDLYPELPVDMIDPDQTDPSWTIDSNSLHRGLCHTLPALDFESTRYALGSVAIELPAPSTYGAESWVVGCDGRRLHRAPLIVVAPYGGPHHPQVLLPGRPAALLTQLIKPKKTKKNESATAYDLNIRCDATSITINHPHWRLYARQQVGRYPRYRDAIPDPAKIEGRATVYRPDLVKACKAALLYRTDETKGIDLIFRDDRLKICRITAADMAEHKQNCDMHEQLHFRIPQFPTASINITSLYADLSGPDFWIVLDPLYLLESVESFPDDKIRIDWIDANNAVLITGYSRAQSVLMPLTKGE